MKVLKLLGQLIVACFKLIVLSLNCLLLTLIAAPLYAIACLIVPADNPFWIPVNEGMAEARRIIVRIYEVWTDES